MRCGSTCLVSLHLDKEDWTCGKKGVGGSRWCGEISLDFLLLSDLDTIDLL